MLENIKTDQEQIFMIDLFYKKLLFKMLNDLHHGELIFVDPMEIKVFGKTTSTCAFSVTLHISNMKFYREVIFSGSIGAAKTYINNYWHTENLVELMRIVIINKQLMNKLEKYTTWFSFPIAKIQHYFNRNSKSGSKKNILAHYDLGNEFFGQFLDKTKMYSSAVFNDTADSLHQASLNKLQMLCDKLALSRADHILEIGTGWGGFAIYAATHYGCHVTTTTISDKQYEYVKERVQALNLQDKITLLNKDYRELSGQFDKIVSIEMLEAVGHQYYPVFFKRCQALLKDKGLALIQVITSKSQLFQQLKNNVDFIKKYIFPGGCLPSINELSRVMNKYTSFDIVDVENIGLHYAKTLHLWHENFIKNLNQICFLGFKEEFINAWKYYFCYCEAAFVERYIDCAQIVIEKMNFE